MAWWEFLDTPVIYQTKGVFVWAGVVAVVSLAGGLGLAYAWHAWKEGEKKKRVAARAKAAPAKAAPPEAAPPRAKDD